MRHDERSKVAMKTLAAASLAAFASTAWGWVNPLEDRYMSGPSMDICDKGAFFVGGVPKVFDFGAGAQQTIIGHMYVQFEIPRIMRQWPLVMIHGGGYTGSALDATPDGREGWFSYAVRNNLATFVADQPGRGRSGFDSSVLLEARTTGNLDLIPTSVPTSSIWTSWFGHIIPDGTDIVTGTMIRHGDPGDPDPAEDPAMPSPAHGNYPPLYPIPPVENSVDPKILAREGAIGPAPNPANNAYLALETYKFQVPSMEATLPGSVCPTCTPTEVAASNTWSPRGLAELLEGLGGAIVSPHSQSSAQVLHMVRILKEHGNLDLVKGIIIPEGGTILEAAGLVPSDFDTIPLLIVNGDYRVLATRQGNNAAVEAINASPTRSVSPAVVMDAENMGPGFLGQTHMNMLGTNNLELFDVFLDWAATNIDNPIVPSQCTGVPTVEDIRNAARQIGDLLRLRAGNAPR